MEQSKLGKLELSNKTLREIRQLSEEGSLQVIIDNALVDYLRKLQFLQKEYLVVAVPAQFDNEGNLTPSLRKMKQFVIL
jgi:hypothetical protein